MAVRVDSALNEGYFWWAGVTAVDHVTDGPDTFTGALGSTIICIGLPRNHVTFNTRSNVAVRNNNTYCQFPVLCMLGQFLGPPTGRCRLISTDYQGILQPGLPYGSIHPPIGCLH